MPYDAIVIGGGLAGCSAAYQLARRGHEVVLLEQDTYPRHKLCGEFLSPEAQSSLRRINALDAVHTRGARPIRHVLLTGPRGTMSRHSLPDTALGLSRYRLDQLLFNRACSAGVDGRTGTKATNVRGSLERGFVVETDDSSFEGRLVLGAYGRRGILDRTLKREFLDAHSPYVAFKAHYEGPSSPSPGLIELYAAPGGYCGIGPVEDNRVNVCWIGEADLLRAAGGTPQAMMHEALCKNPRLRTRMKSLSRTSNDFEAVSQVPLMAKEQFVDDICMIGDAAGMIAPLCGDGMAMALATADMVAPLASDVLSGKRSPSSFRTTYQTRWHDRFAHRMRLGRWIQKAAFRPMATTSLLTACRLLPPLARWLIRATRG